MLGTYVWNGVKVTHRMHSFWDQVVMSEVFLRESYGKYKDVIDPKVIVDIGANIGCFTLRASYDHKDSKIYSWEPFGENFNILQLNINNNELAKRVKIYEFAVGAECLNTVMSIDQNVHNTGGGHLLTPEEKASGGICVAPVAVMDLESVFNITRQDDIDLVKVDIEGGEYHMFMDNPVEVVKRAKVYVGELHDISKNDMLFKRFEEMGYVVSKENNIFLCRRRDVV